MGSSSYRQAGREKKQRVLADGRQVPKHRSHKDTKRWCKGVEGREHDWTVEEWKHDRNWRARGVQSDRHHSVIICRNCRREREIFGGWLSSSVRVFNEQTKRFEYLPKYGPAF